MRLTPGTRLGPYEIAAPLGAGGMGEVYRARDTRLGRDVAIKVLHADVASHSDRLARFEREARTVAGLNHPNIVVLYSVEDDGAVRFLTMELVEGQTLDQHVAPGGMPLARVLDIGIALSDALTSAHEKGVIHRDLKPANVMLTREGRVKVLDFGLAKLADVGSDSGLAATQAPTLAAPLSSAGLVVGTVPYMAPEQVRGEAVDARTDLFALGIILYELATGSRPFTGATSADVSSAILRDAPKPLTSVRADFPGELERIVSRCLEKNPRERAQSALDVGNELRRLRRVLESGGEALAHRETYAMMSAATVAIGTSPPASPVREHSKIAVLPFQNLSAEGVHAYFAGGLHDELLNQLSKVASLKVISRTSVMGYAGTSKPLKQIASELGVGSVVEGSVQVAGERLRVTVQLIDAETDEHLWAERYDRTLDDAFAIQSEVAQQVVAAVGAALTSNEKAGLAAAPTANAEAYRLYLQGREYMTRPGYFRHNWEIAQQLYERALELDPEFALARAALSQVHGAMYWWRYDPSEARAARQRGEAEAALRLAPNLPQAHAAMGLSHYWGHREYRRALDEFAIALRGLPNDAELWWRIGSVNRRVGNWKDLFAAFEKAEQLDPRSATLFMDLGNIYNRLHRYKDAISVFDRALSLAPDLHDAALQRGRAHVLWLGEFGALRSALTRASMDPDLEVPNRADLLLWERNPTDLLKLELAYPDVIEVQDLYLPSALYSAWAHQMLGDQPAALKSFDSARVRLESALITLADDWRVHAAYGMALAGLGRRGEALEEAHLIAQSVVYREDAFDRPLPAEDRARILAQAGDAEAALDEIERMLDGPSFLSAHTLRLDPRWDPLRAHPRFEAMLAKYANPEPVR